MYGSIHSNKRTFMPQIFQNIHGLQVLLFVIEVTEHYTQKTQSVFDCVFCIYITLSVL